MAFSQATITHTFTNADGTPASGTINFLLTKRMTNGTTTIVPAEIPVSLNAQGQLSATLYSNVDAGTVPTDVQWRADMRILGSDQEQYFITVPIGPASVDLGSLLPSAQQVS